jgi:hypothetical protein
VKQQALAGFEREDHTTGAVARGHGSHSSVGGAPTPTRFVLFLQFPMQNPSITLVMPMWARRAEKGSASPSVLYRRAAGGAANTDDSPNHNCTTEVLSWLPSLSRDPIAGVAVFNSILPVSAAQL